VIGCCHATTPPKRNHDHTVGVLLCMFKTPYSGYRGDLGNRDLCTRMLIVTGMTINFVIAGQVLIS